MFSSIPYVIPLCFVHVGFFAVKAFLSSLRSCLFLLLFPISIADGYKNYFCGLCKSVLPVLSSRSFIVSILSFNF